MRSTSARFVVFSVIVAIVASCGGDDSDDTTQSTAAPTAVTVSPSTEPAPTTAAPTTTVAAALPTSEEGVLTVGRTLEVTPHAETDESGNAVGFEPDLVEEMATRLGLTVAWIDTEFDFLLPELDAGRFDMVASNVTLTNERAEQFGFTDPYLRDLEAAAFNEDFANIAFPIDPAHPQLETALSDALQSMLADGTYQSIHDKWFDTPESSVLFERG